MNSKHFVSAVVRRVKSSPVDDANAPKHIYSIRVVDPSIFHFRAEIAAHLPVSGTAMELGSVYSSDLYRLQLDQIRSVLVGMIESGARAMEVKVADEPGGPWDIIRVHLPH